MREYKVVFIDDEKTNTERIAERTKINLAKRNINIDYKILSVASEIELMNETGADILLFDCQFSGSNIIDENEIDLSQFGFNLIQRFREKNKRTKIIFYSGGFKLEGVECYDLTNEEMLQLINNLHVYKMIPKEEDIICSSLVDAIEDLDSVIMSLEDMKRDYGGNGYFVVDNKKYGLNDLLVELKNGTYIGEKFKADIDQMILAYLMKFTGEED